MFRKWTPALVFPRFRGILTARLCDPRFTCAQFPRRSNMSTVQDKLLVKAHPKIESGSDEKYVSFDIVLHNFESLLAVKLKNSHFRLGKASIIAISPNLEIRKTTVNGSAQGILRLLAGGKYSYHEISSPNSSGIVLVSPTKNEDFKIVQLKGSSTYFSSKDVIVATTPGIIIEGVPSILGVGASGALNFSVLGYGSIVISAPYGIYRIELDKNESISVDSRLLLLWESTITTSRSNISTDSKKFAFLESLDINKYIVPLLNALNKYTPESLSKSLNYILDRTARTHPYAITKKILARWTKAIYNIIKNQIQKRFYGHPKDMYTLTGPGEFYLRSPRGGLLTSFKDNRT